MPGLCWDCLVFPVQASKALKISVYVCGCGCGCAHACMNHTHMCIHLCVSVQSSCKHMRRPEIDIAMPSSITSPSITFQLFYLLIFYFYCHLLSFSVYGACVWVWAHKCYVEVKGQLPGVCSPSIVSSRDQTRPFWNLWQALLCTESPCWPSS